MGFTCKPHGATGRGRGGFRGGRGNGGDRNDAYQNDASTNASSNNNAPSAALTFTNHTNTSGWGAEQNGCTFTYIPGPDNVIADAFSRVPRSLEEESSASKRQVSPMHLLLNLMILRC
eukprot:scaffold87096_cov35-Attheya_sp.AAC.1